ncbi:MAG TPA: hypothetical protein VHJ83_05585 [Micromonosporaceae bacterium]|nr:hypothetical protein [Micromonosporaceae bacterium]
MTYPQTAPPPQIPASELRPSRAWYWVAGVIAVLGVCIGGILGIVGFSGLADDVPTPLDTEFDPGSPVTVDLSADRTWAIYVSSAEGNTDVGTECIASPTDGGTINLERTGVNFEFGSGGRTWKPIYDVEVSETGRFRIECRVTDAAATDARFGIAESVDVGNIVGQVLGSLGALLGIPCLALTTAGIIAVVTAVRRNSHKRRRQQELGYLPPGPQATGPPGFGQPPPPGYQTGEYQAPTGGYSPQPGSPPQTSGWTPAPPPPPPPQAPGPQPPPTNQE